ncbi:MAG TPA: hypothetical protein VEJ63_04375 [Planctomycetota bacterium]|nr:hypothetical protein [Planctomycetota bacterium]
MGLLLSAVFSSWAAEETPHPLQGSDRISLASDTAADFSQNESPSKPAEPDANIQISSTHADKTPAALSLPGTCDQRLRRVKLVLKMNPKLAPAFQKQLGHQLSEAQYFFFPDAGPTEGERLVAFCKCCRRFGGRRVLLSWRGVTWLDEEEFRKLVKKDANERGVNLDPPAELDAVALKHAAASIKDLGSEDYEQRSNAFSFLRKQGSAAKAVVAAALESTNDAEVQRQCRQLLIDYRREDELRTNLLLELSAEKRDER